MPIRPIDLSVIVTYLIGITLFGLFLRGKDRSVKSYFLAEERIPWWALSLSIVAAETSTLTLISVPGLAYEGDFSFLQLALGFICGRVLISYTLLPLYFRREIFTAYEWIAHRFGPRLQRTTASVFLVTRAAAEGVRVFAVSIVIGMALAFPASLSGDALAVGIIIALTWVYTYHGGLTAVIWTDVLQTAIYTIASCIGLFSIAHSLPGGWSGFLHSAWSAGKFHTLDFSLSLSRPYTFLAGLIGGTFLTTASHGTDQLLVQRLLAARDPAKARLALISSGFIVFVQFAFYLLIGTALYFLDRAHAVSTSALAPDRIFPHFIVHELPPGLSGLLIAAILAAAMSNLSASLNSLSSTSIMDFYRELRPNRASDDRRTLQIARMATLGWAIVLFGLALLARGGGRVVEVGLSIASVSYGALLGVFLTGWASSEITETPALIGMGVALLADILAWKFTSLAYPWYVPLGCAVCFSVAFVTSRAFRRASVVS